MKNYQKNTILQVLPSLISGGVERGTVDISKALVDNGFQSIVVSSGGPLASSIINHNAKHFELPVSSKNPFEIYRNISSITDIINNNRVNIVHARSRAPAWSSYFAAKKTGVRFITTFHGTYNFNNPIKKFYNSIMAKGEIVIAVSEFIKNHILENYNITEDKLRVIHRGVDTNVFDSANVDANTIENFKIRYNIPTGIPIILLPGRFSHWKGQQFLLETLNELKNKNFLCLMVGDQSRHPSFVKKLIAYTDVLGLAHKIKFFGPEYDMRSLYAISDIVISSSIEPEAFGRISIEAQAMQKIIIATRLGGACETIIHSESGFHIEPNDIFDFAEKIRYALSILGTSLHQKIITRARQSIIENFSLNVMQQKTINVYKELL